MGIRSLRRRRLTLAGCALIAGCATAIPLEPFYYVPAETRGPFAPVRVVVNRDASVPDFYQSRHELIQSELDRSGAFVAVGPDVDSRYVLDVRLTRQSVDSAGAKVGRLLSAATLFLVPTRARNVNQLAVNCFVDGQLARRYEYAGAYEESISLFNYKTLASGGEEFVSLRNLVHHLLRDLDRDDILPRATPPRTEPDKPGPFSI